MKRLASGSWALSFVSLVLVLLLVASPAFALVGSFRVSYGGFFTAERDATTPTTIYVNQRSVGLAPFGPTTLALRMTVDTVPNPNKITQADFVIVAGNGDQIRGQLIGGTSNLDANGYTAWRGKYKFTGGTGRFSKVYGSGNWNALSRINDDGRGLINLNFDGTIGN